MTNQLLTLRDKYLPVFILLLITMASQAQVKQNYPQYGGKWKRLQSDSAIKIPMVSVGIKDANAGLDSAQLMYDPADSSVKVYTGNQWIDAVRSSGGSPNSNIGTGYRLAVPGTNNVKTLFAGYGILKDSTSNANAITTKLDTATVFPAIRATIPATTSLPISSLTAATGANSINNGNNQQTWNWNSLSGYGFLVQSSATTASNGSRLLYVQRSGTNSNAGVTSYSGYFSNSHIGTSSTNIAGLFSAQSGTNNYAIIVPSGGGNVGFGTSTPNASALLDVTSTTQGAVLPRMNTTQMNAISSPVAGLIVYNSDSTSYCYYNGSAWLKMGSGGGGSQDLDDVLTVGNTSTIGAQFGDSVKIQGGTDPFLSFKQATSNQAYRFRVGVGTGLSSQSFSLYDETAAKTRMVMTATGNMLIGGTAAPSAHSRLLVYGGTSGANIDALPDSADNDESNIEVMGADYYGSSFPGYGVAMQFNGNANSGSILGYSKKNFGQLRFTGETNFIRVVNNRSLRFGINSTEVAVLDSNGRFGIGNNAPTARLDVIGEAGNFTPAIIDGHEDVTGELVNVKQSGSKKFSFHSNGSIEMAETTDPTAAATGYNRLYAQAGKLYTHNDDGRVAQVVQTLQLTFGAGSGADADTTAFTTSAIYGSFYNDADTIVVTSMRSVLQGTSPDVTYKVWYNDSLNVEAGATALVTAGSQVTNTTTGTNVTSFDVTKIPPGVWVWVKTSTVATKPKYFSLTINGYRK